MPDDDARLTDFANAGAAERDPEEETAEPAEATLRWIPGGTSCAGCEGTAIRLWRDDEAFVCLDCKDW